MADQMTSTARKSRPHQFNSLVAAAEVITSQSVKRKVDAPRTLPWQQQAWEFYDSVGEFRFGVGWVSNGLSRVNLVAARPPRQPGDEPTPLDPESDDITSDELRAIELVESIGGGASGQGQLMFGFGEMLSIAGLGWMIAEPDLLDPESDEFVTWSVYAQDAVDIRQRGDISEVFIATGMSGGEAWRKAHPNALVVKCWRKHPRRPWEPDAPVRAVLPILDQLDMLSAHITATGRSRLAGAGILAIPSEAQFPDPPPEAADDDGNLPDPFDYFVEQLIEAMVTPIKDRDNASAVVPIAVQIPGEYVDKLKHVTFWTEFADAILGLIADAVKRFALGMDFPPEVLTGMSGVNHWTAWQVEETAVTLHIEPNAEIICNALTMGYLRLAFQHEGIDPATAMVWYDTSDLTVPPDRSANVTSAYDRLEASGSAMRRYMGLSDDDAPDADEFRQRVLLQAARGAPTLAPQMLAAVGLLDPAAAAATEAEAPTTAPGAPNVDAPDAPDTPAGPPSTDAPSGDRGSDAAALIAAADGICYRAMERAGAKLRSAIGRKAGGPQAVETSVDAAALHTEYDATVYADLDHLLDGAFDRVPDVAGYVGVDADALRLTLNAYCRALLASGLPHDRLRLTNALGVDAIV